MATEPEPLPRITKVWARNFRSIEYAEMELGPLTVLVGPNGSGKSNLLDILSFLGDAARDGLEAAITKQGGIESIGRRHARGRAYGPEIGLRWEGIDGRVDYSFALGNAGKGEYWVKQESATFDPNELHAGPLEIKLSKGRLTAPSLKSLPNRVPYDGDGGTRRSFLPLEKEFYEEGLGDQDLILVGREGTKGPLLLVVLWSWFRENSGHSLTHPIPDFARYQISLRRFLGGIGSYHIFPNSLRAPQKAADSHPLAEDGRNLASAVRDMIQQKSRFLPDLKHALGYAVPGVSDIRVSRAGSYLVVELRHDDPNRSERNSWFDLSYESDGTLRLLGLLVALFQEPSPSLISIEEPEVTIHPGAMAVLTDTIQEATLRGQVVVTTHNPDLLDLLPIESIRAVTAESGTTKVDKVAANQVEAVRRELFSPGELHRMEGLQPAVSED